VYKYVQELFDEKQLKESLSPNLLEIYPMYKVQNLMIQGEKKNLIFIIIKNIFDNNKKGIKI